MDVVGGVTDVGAYPGTTSFYSAFDMGGNDWEWNENERFAGFREMHVGGFWDNHFGLFSVSGAGNRATRGEFIVSFRVASIAEPATCSCH